jgi:hypothetical protein
MTITKKSFPFLLVICALFFSIGLFNACKTEPDDAFTDLEKAPDIKERLSQFSPTDISFDESLLNDEQKKVLEKFVSAAKYMDKIFWKQASHNGLSMRENLKGSKDPFAQDFLSYFDINFGPYDRLDENKPFLGSGPKPPGAGFYPPDLTKDYFQGYIDGNPDVKEAFESPYTVIKREGDSLVAVPYSEEYREDLEPAAEYLKQAAEITTNPSLKKYLFQRAEDLLQNDYYQSDCDWIDLEGNIVEIVIGPFEVYEDGLNGIKAAYEAFVYINDLEEMKNIEGYLNYLEEMQKNLPVEPKYKDQKIAGLKSPLNVVFEVFTAGDTKSGVQTLAFVLPNDERVREEKGTKKVFLKNIQEAKFNKVLVPISKKVLTPEDAEHVTFYAYFNETILHEISHVLGVNYVTLEDGSKITVNKALAEHYSPIEESKADVLGLYNVPFLIDKGWIPAEKEKEIYTTYLAGMFRSMRFGVHEAHGLGTLIQFNFLKEKGAFILDEETGKFHVDPAVVKNAIKELAQKLLILEGNGNYEDAEKFIEDYGKLDEITERTIASLADIPVDIKPIFKY